MVWIYLSLTAVGSAVNNFRVSVTREKMTNDLELAVQYKLGLVNHCKSMKSDDNECGGDRGRSESLTNVCGCVC